MTSSRHDDLLVRNRRGAAQVRRVDRRVRRIREKRLAERGPMRRRGARPAASTFQIGTQFSLRHHVDILEVAPVEGVSCRVIEFD
jgi:hypothetical protein